MTNPEIWQTTCLVAGGGPAGMMLAYLLARSGVQTILVEKHGDFLRDFRGYQACCVSATPHTRCPRSAESASITPSPTQ